MRDEYGKVCVPRTKLYIRKLELIYFIMASSGRECIFMNLICENDGKFFILFFF